MYYFNKYLSTQEHMWAARCLFSLSYTAVESGVKDLR